MLDGVASSGKKIWGFEVPVNEDGRKKWPAALRAMAVERIKNGARIREVAEEIGAHKSLVAHWIKAAKPVRNVREFFEVLPPPSNASKSIKNHNPYDASEAPICLVRIGDMEIAIPAGYPSDGIAQIQRLARSAVCLFAPKPCA